MIAPPEVLIVVEAEVWMNPALLASESAQRITSPPEVVNEPVVMFPVPLSKMLREAEVPVVPVVVKVPLELMLAP